MSIEDFVSFVRQLELGQKIYLNSDKTILEPIFIGVEIDFENLEALSLQFSDKYSSSDSAFRLVDLLDQSISVGKTVNSNKLTYSSFVDSGASSKVKEFMDSALDVAKNAILSSSGQGVVWDNTGLHLRKYIDTNNTDLGYEDEQIWMINNSIVFTDDNWQTAKMAIGKIIDENIARYPETSDTTFNANKVYYYIDDEGEYQVWEGDAGDWADRPLLYEKDITAYGIVAPYIVGTLIAGQNLVIDTPDGSFRVDSSGVHIDSMKFFITHDGVTEDTALQEELDKLAEEANDIALDLAGAIESIGDLNDKVENTVTTYYQSKIPDNAREGDLWYVIDDEIEDSPEDNDEYEIGKLYRFNGEGWDEITDAAVIEAIEKANNAQTTADGKITSFYQNYIPPTPSFGDLWFNTADSQTVTRPIEVGDNLGGITLTFDTRKIITNESSKDIITGGAGSSGRINHIFASNRGAMGRGVWLTANINGVSKIIYNGSSWLLRAFTVPTTFGVVTEVTKDSAFYGRIYGTFTNNYLTKKWYRYNGTTWVLVEDGDISTVKNNINNITQTLGQYITQEGYLTANKLKGAISTALTTMQNGIGNVVFDEGGLWLLNQATKETATTAVWINERGILFGTGTKGYIEAEDGDDNAWTWTTAIGHDGIIADAMATKTLSAFTINGGSINIGNGRFVVDSNGNLTARSGTFSGTLDAATISGDIKSNTGSDSWILGCGISIGDNPTNSSGNFYVDTDGNVTMKGNINMSEGNITWSSSNTPVQVQYSADGSSWHTTFKTTDYYARYSYDGGTTWTSAIPVKGKDGEKGEQGEQGERGPRGYAGADGSDAEVTFANVNSALGLLFKTYSGGTPTTISDSYIYSPQVKGGEFYGGTFYAGTGTGFSQMSSAGFNVFDENGNKKIGLGCYSGNWSYPYLSLGVGAGTSANGSGLVMKLGSGVWIGDSSILTAGGNYPGGESSATNISSSYSNATGIFIDFNNDIVYRYYEGVPSEIGSGTAKFG